MNTAQSVTLGHKPKLIYNRENGADLIFLYARTLFVISTGSILTWTVLAIKRLNSMDENRVSAMFLSIHFLSVLFSVYFFVACGIALHLSVYYHSYVFFTTLVFISFCTVLNSVIYVLKYLSTSYDHRNRILAIFCLYGFGGNAISSISCWCLIGIIINPSWGLTVILSVISIFAAFTYAVYLYLDVTYPNGYDITTREITLKNVLLGTYSLPKASLRYFPSSSGPSQNNNTDTPKRVTAFLKSFTFSDNRKTMVVCVIGFFAVGSLYVVVILAGPSIGGQTASEELLKTSSLYFITAFIAWATLGTRARASPLQNERPQNAEGQDTKRHTGDDRVELGTPVTLSNN